MTPEAPSRKRDRGPAKRAGRLAAPATAPRQTRAPTRKAAPQRARDLKPEPGRNGAARAFPKLTRLAALSRGPRRPRAPIRNPAPGPVEPAERVREPAIT